MKPRARKRVVPSRVEKRLTEQKIVAAALEHIDAVGLAKFSLRDVARALDVYPTAVYWYVKTRDELLGRVVAYATLSHRNSLQCRQKTRPSGRKCTASVSRPWT